MTEIAGFSSTTTPNLDIVVRWLFARRCHALFYDFRAVSRTSDFENIMTASLTGRAAARISGGVWSGVQN
jgi:hypothetical protein